MADEDEIPPDAEEAYRLAMLAFGQSQEAISPETKRALMRLGKNFLKKAEALGWRSPVLLRKRGRTSPS
jgi:hypothetical protein